VRVSKRARRTGRCCRRLLRFPLLINFVEGVGAVAAVVETCSLATGAGDGGELGAARRLVFDPAAAVAGETSHGNRSLATLDRAFVDDDAFFEPVLEANQLRFGVCGEALNRGVA
jgi:hypothetical protein